MSKEMIIENFIISNKANEGNFIEIKFTWEDRDN